MNSIGKHIQLIGIMLLTIFVGAAASLYFDVPTRLQRTSRKESASRQYICPMHHDVVSAKSGNCPKCGMTLKLVSGTSTAQGCESHDSACCAKRTATSRSLPPGHPPIDGYPAPSSSPAGTNHSY
jgi:hypothetical protein